MTELTMERPRIEVATKSSRTLSREQLDIEIQKGFDDLKAGRIAPARHIRENLQNLRAFRAFRG
ncbi:MAG: hypothetical protein LBE35_00670 [Clostridiales bacterium]|jgi:hypothetical protein|nr:hypothetical protein [Clostridiales bacterium]